MILILDGEDRNAQFPTSLATAIRKSGLGLGQYEQLHLSELEERVFDLGCVTEYPPAKYPVTNRISFQIAPCASCLNLCSEGGTETEDGDLPVVDLRSVKLPSDPTLAATRIDGYPPQHHKDTKNASNVNATVYVSDPCVCGT